MWVLVYPTPSSAVCLIASLPLVLLLLLWVSVSLVAIGADPRRAAYFAIRKQFNAVDTTAHWIKFHFISSSSTSSSLTVDL